MQIKYLLILLGFSFFFSCKKEDIELPLFLKGDATSGCVKAIVNDKEWLSSGQVIKRSSGKYTLRGVSYTHEGYQRHILNFSNLNPETGTFPVYSSASTQLIFCGFYTRADGGDVGEDIYVVDTSKDDNQITITLFDTLAMRVEGTFSVAFEYDNSYEEKENPDNPNKFKLTEGEFAVDIVE